MFYFDSIFCFHSCCSPAPVSEGASTIHLPVKDCHIAEGTNCTMYGWGETKSTAFFYPYAMPLCILTITQSKRMSATLNNTLQHMRVPLCPGTGHDETLNAVTMPMVNNDMCSQIKGDAGESRICAGGKRGEGICDVRVTTKNQETDTTPNALEKLFHSKH